MRTDFQAYLGRMMNPTLKTLSKIDDLEKLDKLSLYCGVVIGIISSSFGRLSF
jgi:hypothetical protein